MIGSKLEIIPSKSLNKVFISRLVLLISTVISANNIIAQSGFSGIVVDENSHPLTSANVVVSDSEDGKILNYSFTNEIGEYKISFESVWDSVIIKVSHLGFKDISQLISKNQRILNFQLETDAEELKEVFVRAPPPITVNSDTLEYGISQFKTKGDVVLSDVLKRLPGIEVESNGRILYQGNPIQKFYINGLDLLEGKYNLANNSLPASAVQKIQILENHNPIKILDSINFSEKSSLNVKLKQEVTVTGKGEAGLGVSPLLWGFNLTPILFSKKKQLLVSYQTNNIGQDLSNETTDLTFDNLDKFAAELRRDWLGVQRISSPPLPISLWLDNKTNLVAANYLSKLSNNLQLKVNLSYLHDLQQEVGNSSTRIFTPTDTINISETVQNDLNINQIDAKITLLKNTDKSYFKNVFEFGGNLNSEIGILNRDTLIRQGLKANKYDFINTLNGIIPFKNELIRIDSEFSFENDQQTLNVNSNEFSEAFNTDVSYRGSEQDLIYRRFVTDNKISIIKSIKAFTFSPKVGIRTEKNLLSSDILIKDNSQTRLLNDNFSNNLKLDKKLIYIDPSLEFKKDKLRIELKLPLNLYSFSIDDNVRNTKFNSSLIAFEPILSLNKDLNIYWNMRVMGSIRKEFGSIDKLYRGFILSNYRTLRSFESTLPESTIKKSGVELQYKNPIKSTFFNTSYTFSRSLDNQIQSSVFLPNGESFIETESIDNKRNNHLFFVKGSKFYKKIKGLLSLGANMNFIDSQQLIGQNLIDIQNSILRLDTKFNTKVNDWLDSEFRANFQYTQIKSFETKAKFISNYYSLKTNFYPTEDHQITLTGEIYNNKFAEEENNTEHFLNLSYKYKINKRLQLEGSWNNIFNLTEFTSVFNNDNISQLSTYRLRPTQVFVRLLVLF